MRVCRNLRRLVLAGVGALVISVSGAHAPALALTRSSPAADVQADDVAGAPDPAGPSSGTEDGPDPTPDPKPDPKPDSGAADSGDGQDVQPKETVMTRGELQRQLDLQRGRLEDLLNTFESQKEPPTPEQLEKFKTLRHEVSALEAKIEAMTPEAPAPEDDSWRARWVRYKHALQDVTRYDLKDGMFRFRLGLDAQIDATMADGDQILTDTYGGLPNSLNLRRLRIFAKGRLIRRWDFTFQYDFGADSGVKDAWIEGVKFVRFARWRFGQFKEPFSFERHASAYNLPFLEWATPVATFAPGRGVGGMLRHDELEGRMQWAMAFITSGQSGADNAGTSNITFTTRVSGTPLFEDNGRFLAHVGMSYSARNPRGGTIRYRTRPEARFITPFLDTGSMDANGDQLIGLEFATVMGRWWAQWEFIGSALDASALGDPRFSGTYVSTGWFLTGESRPYDSRDGTFGRVLPFRPYRAGGNPFKPDSNGGALEVLARLSTTDLTDASVRAGKIDDLSLGMSWYLTPATKLMANYIHSRVDNGDGGKANVFLIRYQFHP